MTTLFLGFEIFSFYGSDNNKSSELLAQGGQECNHTFPETQQTPSQERDESSEKSADNEKKKVSEPTAVTTTITVAPVQDQEPLKKEPVEATKDEAVVENPIEKVLATTNEEEAWKLYTTYNAYSDEEKEKLLNHAVFNNHADNLAKMLDAGYSFSTPHYMGDANKLIFTRKYQVVILLIKRDLIDVFKTNQYGYTLLHEASAKGHSDLIRLLVSKGVDINAQARSGASALHYPTRYGYSITVNTLLELGIDPNLKATLNYGAISWNQSTALHIATKRGFSKLVKKLLDTGADPSIKDAHGMTALDIAKQLNHEDIMLLLKPEDAESDEDESVDADERSDEDDNTTLDHTQSEEPALNDEQESNDETTQTEPGVDEISTVDQVQTMSESNNSFN